MSIRKIIGGILLSVPVIIVIYLLGMTRGWDVVLFVCGFTAGIAALLCAGVYFLLS